jgi:hypothetical protein
LFIVLTFQVVGIGDAQIQRSAVTVKNRLDYIKAYVHYKLVDEISGPMKCLKSGFQEVIHASWLSLFRAPSELQLILCGDQGPVDLDDLQANTTYSGEELM